MIQGSIYKLERADIKLAVTATVTVTVTGVEYCSAAQLANDRAVIYCDVCEGCECKTVQSFL